MASYPATCVDVEVRKEEMLDASDVSQREGVEAALDQRHSVVVGHHEGSVTLWDFRPLELALSLDEPLNALRPGLCDATIALLKGGSLDRITSQHLKLVEVLLRKRAQSEVSIVVPAAANGSCPMPRSSRG